MSRIQFTTKYFLVLFVAAGSIFGPGIKNIALANAFPEREIELVVPVSPGGSTDAMARIVGDKVSEYLGVPVIIVNKPGGGTVIGTNYMLTSTDGYRISTGGNSNLGPAIALEKAPFTLRDFSAIAMAVTNPLIIITKSGKYESFGALIKKAEEKPGALTFASWGVRSPSHVYGELLNQVTGVKIKHVPFEGGAPAMVAVMGEHVDIAIVTVVTAKSNVRGGTISGLAVTSEQRVNALPNVPSIKELGFPDAVYQSFDGFATSSKVPKQRLMILRSAFQKSLNDPKVLQALEKIGSIPKFMNGEDYEVFLERNLVLLKKVAVKAGIIK